jgi:hypothetical protein
MRFMDPLNVDCPNCGRSLQVPVSRLLELTAICTNCDASLTAIGERMHQKLDEVACSFIAWSAIVEVEDEFHTKLPDSIVETLVSEMSTKADFVRELVSYLSLTVPVVDPKIVEAAFDRSIGRGALSGSISLLEVLGPARFVERVELYRPALPTGPRGLS